MKSRFFWIFLMAFLLVGCSSSNVPKVSDSQPEATVEVQTATPINVDFGEFQIGSTIEVDKSTSVLDGLEQFTQSQDYELIIKEYSFGSLVESINGVANTSDRVWIYYVNGQVGDVGADQKQIQRGDYVEWKYEPIKN